MPPTSVLPEFDLLRDSFKTKTGPVRKMPPALPPLWQPWVTARFGCLVDSDQPSPASSMSSTAPLWTPLPGPQTMALESAADELFFGGSAGGGKSMCLLGAALTQHQRSVIFRREYRQLRALIEESRGIVGQHGSFNETAGLWRLDDGRTVEFGAVEHEWDKMKWQGRPHSLKAFDELAQFTESQYTFLSGWARTTDTGERVRVMSAGNPPMDTEGEWVIRRWAAWLDPQHPHPAEPGELRWYAMLGGEEQEVEDGTPFEHGGETVYPRSRTFIPARVQDNPYLMATGYVATLQGLTEPMRSQMLYGDFSVGLTADPWQVIPTAWIEAAQRRWTEGGRDGRALDCVGVDVAQGGDDRTVLARRYGGWFAPLEALPGRQVPDTTANAAVVLRALADGGVAQIDADGIGAATVALCQVTVRERARAYLGSAPAPDGWQDAAGVFGYQNVRAAAWWSLREALDPSQRGGSGIALPPDRDLRVELASPRFTIGPNGIAIEKKVDIKKRLGRSTDLGDSIVMAHWTDPRAGYASVFGAVGQVQSAASTVRRIGRR